jgi:hypothetical protein
MRIQLYKNKKGLIYGDDPSHIVCDKGGILRIGTETVNISEGKEAIFPSLVNGNHKAVFTTGNKVYVLETVVVRGGRVLPPTKEALEIMELRVRLDELEDVCDSLKEKVIELSNIFDTNSLNFLIN